MYKSFRLAQLIRSKMTTDDGCVQPSVAAKLCCQSWAHPACEQNGGSSSSVDAEIEADGCACMGEQSREERDAKRLEIAFNIEDS